MAIDSYMAFVTYDGKTLDAESQVDAGTFSKDTLLSDVSSSFTTGKIFEIDDYSFDIEQTLNIGSQASGAGAGKITFNPFSITRKVDKSSPIFFQMACSGTPFQFVYLALRKAAGTSNTTGAGLTFLRFDFKLVAVKTVSWSHDETSPLETITFEYGGLQMRYAPQKPDGSMGAAVVGGWNRVKNVVDTGNAKIA
jgi:type VI secretion system secreted protein Hcp